MLLQRIEGIMTITGQLVVLLSLSSLSLKCMLSGKELLLIHHLAQYMITIQYNLRSLSSGKTKGTT